MRAYLLLDIGPQLPQERLAVRSSLLQPRGFQLSDPTQAEWDAVLLSALD